MRLLAAGVFNRIALNTKSSAQFGHQSFGPSDLGVSRGRTFTCGSDADMNGPSSFPGWLRAVLCYVVCFELALPVFSCLYLAVNAVIAVEDYEMTTGAITFRHAP